MRVKKFFVVLFVSLYFVFSAHAQVITLVEDMSAIAVAIQNGITIYNELQTAYQNVQTAINQYELMMKNLRDFDWSAWDPAEFNSWLSVVDDYMTMEDEIEYLVTKKSFSVAGKKFSMEDLFSGDTYEELYEAIGMKINPDNVTQQDVKEFTRKYGLSYKHYDRLHANTVALSEGLEEIGVKVEGIRPINRKINETLKGFKQKIVDATGQKDIDTLQANVLTTIGDCMAMCVEIGVGLSTIQSQASGMYKTIEEERAAVLIDEALYLSEYAVYQGFRHLDKKDNNKGPLNYNKKKKSGISSISSGSVDHSDYRIDTSTFTWFNKYVYTFFDRIGAFQFYFVNVCKYLAAILFSMSLLMLCIKAWMGIANVREQVLKLFTTTVIYLVLMVLYPVVMKAVLPFAMNLGYSATFESGLSEIDLDNRGTGSWNPTMDDFYLWLGEHSNGLFSTKRASKKNVADSVDVDQVKAQLNFNLVMPGTGLIDLNKTFNYIGVFLRISMSIVPHINIMNITISLLIHIGMLFLAIIIVIFLYFMVIFNYLTCLIDYFSLMGFGVLMIPLSLWDGTKSYTESLFSSLGKIIIKLLVISAMFFLSVMCIVNIYGEMYVYSRSTEAMALDAVGLSLRLPDLCLSMIVQGILMYIIISQTDKIAGFLMGGTPSMNFKDALAGIGGMAATGFLAAKGANSAVNGIGGIGGQAMASVAAGSEAKHQGGSFLGGMAQSLGAGAAKGLGSAVKGLPGAGKDLAAGFRVASGAESFDTAMWHGHLGGNGNGRNVEGGGGGSSGGGSGGNGLSDQEKSVSENESRMAEGGNSGVYGNASNGESAVGNRLVRSANQMSTSNNAAVRSIARQMGIAGNVMNSVAEGSGRRARGSEIGESRLADVGSGLKSGAMGAIAQGINYSGGGHFATGAKGPEETRGQMQNVRHNGAESKDRNAKHNVSMDRGINGAEKGPPLTSDEDKSLGK